MPILNSAYQELHIVATPTVYVNTPIYVTINNASGKNLLVGAYLYPSAKLLIGATLQQIPHLYFYCMASFVYPGSSLPVSATIRGSDNNWTYVYAMLGMSESLLIDANLISTYKIYTTASMASSTYDDTEVNAYFPLLHDLGSSALLAKGNNLLCETILSKFIGLLSEAIIADHDYDDFPINCTMRSSDYHDLSATALFKGTQSDSLISYLRVRKRDMNDFLCNVSIYKTENLRSSIKIQSVYGYLANIKIVLVRTLGRKQRYITEVLTDDNGYFTFTNIPAGTYNIIPVNSEYFFMPRIDNIEVTGNINNLEFYAFDEFTTPAYNNFTPQLHYDSGYTITGRVIYISCNNLLFGCAFDYDGVNQFTNNFIKYK